MTVKTNSQVIIGFKLSWVLNPKVCITVTQRKLSVVMAEADNEVGVNE